MRRITDQPVIDTSTGATTTSTNASCAVTPTETIGPYPSRTDMFRSDVRENRQGTPLTLTIKVVNVNSACAAVSGADRRNLAVRRRRRLLAVRIADGRDLSARHPDDERRRRGDVHDDLSGLVSGAGHAHPRRGHDGRAIGEGHADGVPESINNAVHASGVYASRGTNPMSNQSDGIFADSLASELVTPTGSPSSGYTATFQVGVAG